MSRQNINSPVFLLVHPVRNTSYFPIPLHLGCLFPAHHVLLSHSVALAHKANSSFFTQCLQFILVTLCNISLFICTRFTLHIAHITLHYCFEIIFSPWIYLFSINTTDLRLFPIVTYGNPVGGDPPSNLNWWHTNWILHISLRYLRKLALRTKKNPILTLFHPKYFSNTDYWGGDHIALR